MATERIDGVNMFSRMSAVPREVLLDTFDKVMRYYEDIAVDTDDRLYLVELSLSGMYDRTPSDDTPRVYVFDIDPWLSNVTRRGRRHWLIIRYRCS